METFAKLFGSLLVFMYHCFDRIVILGHIPLLTRPENIVHFFRDLHHAGAITQDLLRKRTDDIAPRKVNIPAASRGAFDRTAPHANEAPFYSRGGERQRAVVRRLAGARRYTNQGEASFAVSNPKRMKRRHPGSP